jgi:hypothetical protein
VVPLTAAALNPNEPTGTRTPLPRRILAAPPLPPLADEDDDELADGGSAGGGIDMLGIPLWYAAAAAVRLGLLPGNAG